MSKRNLNIFLLCGLDSGTRPLGLGTLEMPRGTKKPLKRRGNQGKRVWFGGEIKVGLSRKGACGGAVVGGCGFCG